jgi:hypothetical protein
VVGVYDTRAQAERAIRILEAGGFSLRRLSLVGEGYHSEETPTGFYTTGDRMRTWGAAGLFWGGLWGLLSGSLLFSIPGVGDADAAGPLMHLALAAAAGALLVGGVGALGAALVGLGLPRRAVIRYERHMRADRYLAVARGTPDELERACALVAQERDPGPGGDGGPSGHRRVGWPTPVSRPQERTPGPRIPGCVEAK